MIRRPYRVLLIAIVLGYVLGAVAYVVVLSAWSAAQDRYVTFFDVLPVRCNDVALFTFFFVTGGSVGSFLNVVVWRVPQGMTIRGHSFCPRCRHELRAWDNVPILGWLKLGGRCRTCRLPISSRYPIVELSVAVCFAIVGMVEIYRWNLPFESGGHDRGALAAPAVDGKQLLTLAYHFFGMASLWVMALIRWDGNRIPTRLTFFCGGVLVIGMLLMPSLAIVPSQWTAPTDWPPDDAWETQAVVQSLVRILASLAGAAFLARVFSRWLCPTADLKSDPLGDGSARLVDVTMILGVAAILVGWQAMLGIAPLSLLSQRLLRQKWVGSDILGRFAVALVVVTTMQITFWRYLRW